MLLQFRGNGLRRLLFRLRMRSRSYIIYSVNSVIFYVQPPSLSFSTLKGLYFYMLRLLESLGGCVCLVYRLYIDQLGLDLYSCLLASAVQVTYSGC
jgi:hypothetical protein